VSIVNDGVGEAGVTAISSNGITISTGANDVVNLRGLTLVGSGPSLNNGIEFINLGALNIQNCVIRGFAGGGIAFLPSGSAAVNVSDTIGSGVGIVAITIAPTGSGTVTAAFNRVQAIGSGNGFAIAGLNAVGVVNATIANSAATNNGTNGISVEGATGKA